MPFLQLSLDIGARNPEPYEDALFELGALSVTLLDAADDPVLEPAPGATPLWPSKTLEPQPQEPMLLAPAAMADRGAAISAATTNLMDLFIRRFS